MVPAGVVIAFGRVSYTSNAVVNGNHAVIRWDAGNFGWCLPQQGCGGGVAK